MVMPSAVLWQESEESLRVLCSRKRGQALELRMTHHQLGFLRKSLTGRDLARRMMADPMLLHKTPKPDSKWGMYGCLQASVCS